MKTAATATVIGALKASPVVLRWVLKARSAGAEIRRPRREIRYAAGTGTGQVLDLEAFERVDDTFGRPAGAEELVVLASRTGDAADATIAGLHGDEIVVLLPAGTTVDHDEPGRAWVALVGLAGRPGNTTVIEPSVRETTARRGAAVIRHPRTGGVPATAARTDRGLSARGKYGRTGPPALVLCSTAEPDR